MAMIEAYFQFKPFYNKQPEEKAYLGDFIELSAAEDVKQKIEEILVFPYGINKPVRLTSVQIISLIKQQISNIIVIPIGESSALFQPVQQKKDNPLLAFLRVAFSMLLLFFWFCPGHNVFSFRCQYE